MKKVGKFIMKYRIQIVLCLLLLFLSFIFITFYKYINPEDKTTKYGNRLDGIEKVPITSKKKEEIINFIKEDEKIEKVSIDIRGRIINISIIATDKENTIDKMKEKCNEIITKFTDEEIAFYDFQIFIKNEDANYNLIAYKNKKNKELSYSSDVIVREVEENEKDEEKQ